MEEFRLFAAQLVPSLLLSLALTLVLELGFALLWGLRRWEDLRFVLLVNAMTNPPVVFLSGLLIWLAGAPALPVQLPLEAAVVAGEWLCCRAFGFRRPFLFALGANAFSYGLGLLVTRLL